jgi:hypothetical protein
LSIELIAPALMALANNGSMPRVNSNGSPFYGK